MKVEREEVYVGGIGERDDIKIHCTLLLKNYYILNYAYIAIYN